MQEDIKSKTIEELAAEFAEMGLPRYAARQVFAWLHQKNAKSFEQMTNISKQNRIKLCEKYYISIPILQKRLVSTLDSTVKYLCELYDGERIECVFMRYHHGNTLCISTQAGCRMGCAFCASTQNGLSRNLTAGEMLSQIQFAQEDLGEKVNNVVLMGIGEPLDNYDNVLRFLTLVRHEDGLNIGHRHISLSTCGLVDKIYALMEERLQVTLSVSLHAPNDEIRSRMMPVNRRWPIEKLLAACKEYGERTGRRISFEYSLVDGVNDSIDNAVELAGRLRGILCHVNLIPVNEIGKKDIHTSRAAHIRAFQKTLEEHGYTVTVRRTLGADINASCGQLRADRGDNIEADRTIGHRQGEKE